MAVYEQLYEPYRGAETPRAFRFLVIPRYAYQRLFGSKLWWFLLAASVLTTLAFASLIYVRYNTRALALFGITTEDVNRVLPIGGSFFSTFLAIQFGISFVVVLVAGPRLMSMDLGNGALPLYLGRPISRPEYVLGKFVILGAGVSLTTWISGLALFALSMSLEGLHWGLENAWLAFAILAGSWAWIVSLSTLTLALSALIRWPLAVRGVLITTFLLLPAFGLLIYQTIGARWALLLNPWADLRAILHGLFGLPPIAEGAPLVGAWVVLIGVTAVSLLILARKLRAYEVVS